MMPSKSSAELKTMLESGLSLDDSLLQLGSKGVSIIQCIIAVKEATGCELGEAKHHVHTGRTWQDLVEATEKMWQDLADPSQDE